jgi:DNA-binding IclR family transcriptional regulator
LEKAIRILVLLSTIRQSMDVNQISKQLGFPKSTVYRLIKVLAKHGLIEQDTEFRGYRLGTRLFQMANVVKYYRRVADIARPFMEELRNITGETVILAVIEEGRATVLRKVEGTHALRMVFDEGRTMPLHAGAASKILLAHLSAEEQDRIIQEGLPRYSENTITDAIRLKKELAKIRQDGYAESDSELHVGAKAIAAPIRNFSGQVMASINLVGPAHRFQEPNMREYISLVKGHAEKISHMMGYGLIQNNTRDISLS